MGIRQGGATFRNCFAFSFAAGAAYSIGFVSDMWVEVATSHIPANNVAWPSYTWLAISLACLVAAFLTNGSALAIAIPFALHAAVVFVFAPSSREIIFIACPLLVASIAIFLYQRRTLNVRTQTSTRPSFQFGEYKLDDALGKFTDLVEFSKKEYEEMGRQFMGEKNYNAPPTLFLGCAWNVKLQSVGGKICKIAPYLVRQDKQAANRIAMQTLQFCREQLGKPAEHKTGLFVWDTTDGNVILQTGETGDGFLVSLFLTSHSVRDLERL